MLTRGSMSRWREKTNSTNERNPMRKTILVIDPDRTHLAKITSFWHDQPWQTITTNTLEEAIDILDDTSIDMIIAIDELGWLNGAEFLRLTHHRYPRMFRILVTNEPETVTERSYPDFFHAEDHFHLATSHPCDSREMTAIVHEMFGLEDRMSCQVSGTFKRSD